jgi:HlyD family secretion protein
VSISKPTPSTSTARAQSLTGSPKGSWQKKFPWVIGIGLVWVIVGGLLPKPLEVETFTVAKAPLTVSVLEEGKTRIKHRHVITAPFAGRLKRQALRAGDRLEAGKTVLLEVFPDAPGLLNPRLLAEAEARLKGAEAVRLRSVELVGKVRASLSFTMKEKERAVSLSRTGAATAKDLDSATSQLEVLERELKAAEYGVQIAEFDVAQAKAALVQGAGLDGEQSAVVRIVAPVNGVVLNVFEENERLVAPGTPVLEVGDPTDLEAEIELLSCDAVGVKAGALVSIEQWGGPKVLTGRVTLVESGGYTKISALGVEEQRVKVRVDFAEPLLPEWGMGDRYRVEARIKMWSAPEVLQVPTGALFRRGGDWFTFVVDGGRATLSKVEIAHNNGTAAEVRSGLTAGQTVILHAPEGLVEGKTVRSRGGAGH